MQRRTMRLAFDQQPVGVRKGFDFCQQIGRKGRGRIAEHPALAIAHIRAMRTRTGNAERPGVTFDVANRAPADQREPAPESF